MRRRAAAGSRIVSTQPHREPPRSNAAGVLEDIPLSHWEQLVGLFDVRAPSCTGNCCALRTADVLTWSRAAPRAKEGTPARESAPATPSLGQLSLADDDAAWPGLKMAADEVTPLPSDFAGGQLNPENLFDPEMGAF